MKSMTNTIVINSDKNEFKKVKKFLCSFFDKNQLPKKKFNNVLLCLAEAVINSIKHGNQEDYYKKVKITIEYIFDKIYIYVQDEGEGFDCDSIDDPTLVENLIRETGRGIYIIKALSEKVTYINSGRTIKIKIGIK